LHFKLNIYKIRRTVKGSFKCKTNRSQHWSIELARPPRLDRLRGNQANWLKSNKNCGAFFPIVGIVFGPSSLGEADLDRSQRQLLHIVPGIHSRHPRRGGPIDAQDFVAVAHLVGLLGGTTWLGKQNPN